MFKIGKHFTVWFQWPTRPDQKVESMVTALVRTVASALDLAKTPAFVLCFTEVSNNTGERTLQFKFAKTLDNGRCVIDMLSSRTMFLTAAAQKIRLESLTIPGLSQTREFRLEIKTAEPLVGTRKDASEVNEADVLATLMSGYYCRMLAKYEPELEVSCEDVLKVETKLFKGDKG